MAVGLGVVLLTAVASAGAPEARASQPGATAFSTDNPRLNAKIRSGRVTVAEVPEPSQEEQQAINAALAALGHDAAFLASRDWDVKRQVAREQLGPVPGRSRSGAAAPLLGTMTLDGDGYLNWSVYVFANAGAFTRNRMYITSAWDWNRKPAWFLTEKVGFAWGSDNIADVFLYETGSLRNAAHFHGCTRSGSCKTLRIDNPTVDRERSGLVWEWRSKPSPPGPRARCGTR